MPWGLCAQTSDVFFADYVGKTRSYLEKVLGPPDQVSDDWGYYTLLAYEPEPASNRNLSYSFFVHDNIVSGMHLYERKNAEPPPIVTYKDGWRHITDDLGQTAAAIMARNGLPQTYLKIALPAEYVKGQGPFDSSMEYMEYHKVDIVGQLFYVSYEMYESRVKSLNFVYGSAMPYQDFPAYFQMVENTLTAQLNAPAWVYKQTEAVEHSDAVKSYKIRKMMADERYFVIMAANSHEDAESKMFFMFIYDLTAPDLDATEFPASFIDKMREAWDDPEYTRGGDVAKLPQIKP